MLTWAAANPAASQIEVAQVFADMRRRGDTRNIAIAAPTHTLGPGMVKDRALADNSEEQQAADRRTNHHQIK